jgi:hypothetical protein
MPDPELLDIELRRFFAEFSRAKDAPDLETRGACFADAFLAAGPAGAKPMTRPEFLRAISRRARTFADAGLGPATLDSLTHQQLDEHYVLARTEWTAARSGGGPPARLSSSYLLHRQTDGFRIVLYLNHQGPPQNEPSVPGR